MIRGKMTMGKTVVVGIKMDAESRELLTWTLVKVAEPGDLVVALHVLPHAGRSISEKNLDSCSSLMSVIVSFDSMLASYDGFCKLKQVDLKLKICRGSSVRKIIVREVCKFSAAVLVLGVAKNSALIRSLNSIVKHCGKRVPRECSVMAVKNGKIIFRREAPPTALSNQGENLNCSSPPERETESEDSETLDSNQTANGGEISCADDKIFREMLQRLPLELQSLLRRCSSTCRLFSYQELLDATSNFSTGMQIGKGGGSRVYRGVLPGGRELAVKLLQRSDYVLKDFASEVEILSDLHHRSIISLLGFCIEDENLALIYDYYPRGSLEENLHGTDPSLKWIERFEVAVGVAEALDYLHGASGIPRPVIHGDVKSSNILLSDDLQPRLSDFGFARWRSSASSNLSGSDITGTFGYLAPEYLICGNLSEEVDVYAFGVVLLELLTGKKPIDTENPGGPESLVTRAKPILRRGKLKQILDPRLREEYDEEQVERTVLAADLCLERVPRLRPRMEHILKLLRGEEDAVEKGRELQIEAEEEDEEAANPAAKIQSYLSLALRDVEDDSFSIASSEHTSDFILSHSSLEEYLRGRWSLHSSFGTMCLEREMDMDREMEREREERDMDMDRVIRDGEKEREQRETEGHIEPTTCVYACGSLGLWHRYASKSWYVMF